MAVDGVSVVIPAYNEEAGIAGDIKTIHEAFHKAGLPYEIIVVDDGSRDKTAEEARRAGGVRLIRHRANRGWARPGRPASRPLATSSWSRPTETAPTRTT